MKQIVLLLFLSLSSLYLFAQKKPLDHSVYDGWQSIGERAISRDGAWAVYTITPQEGDAQLYIKPISGNGRTVSVARGYNAVITEDNRFVVFRIRPTYKETREARIKKKRPDEMPKDSFGIVELGKEGVMKMARVRSYKTPAKAGGWLAIHKEREPQASRAAAAPTQKAVDSLRKTIDSLTMLVTQIKNEKGGARDGMDADEDPVPGGGGAEGSELLVRNLAQKKERIFRNVVDYGFSENGNKLYIRTARAAGDRSSSNAVLVFHTGDERLDTVLKGGNDFRNFAFSEDGRQFAFIGERDTAKAPVKTYGLYLYRDGDDSAQLLVNKHNIGMEMGQTVSEWGNPSFSKSGRRLFFGTAALPTPKDTSLVDIDLVKLDIWHYNDDYLQTQQLYGLNNELRRNYLALYDLGTHTMTQLGSKGLPNIFQTGEGDGDLFYGVTDTGRRVAAQWSGSTKKDIYAIDPKTGKRTLVKKNYEGGGVYPSSTGKYLLLFDNKTRHYFAWDGKGLKNLTAAIRVPLYDEDHDTPSDPGPYGIMGWSEGDSAVYLYDRYDIWKVGMNGSAPQLVTGGRKASQTYRALVRDNERQFYKHGEDILLRRFDQKTKISAIVKLDLVPGYPVNIIANEKDHSVSSLLTPRDVANNGSFLFTKENYIVSPTLMVAQGLNGANAANNNGVVTRLATTNEQQSQYNWGRAELFKWKTFDGKSSEGILYKPEDFDSTKKYPMIIYFYEKLSETLHNYIAPAPTPSRLNIPFFVSRGYLVFAPDISYTKGQPGKDAYNYIVSGAQALAKKRWVDARNIGIQGQSWGGYQVAYLITRTNMFKAAWAGAPVVNMFSAYGGIRWESGNNRQFQYEKGQSRIGATPWERPDLYIESSPFFHLKKVQTPLVIMANDADGAVPWYQGIEAFTAMRRLNKKVWMLNYNGEAHNLVDRRARKDIQIREQQFFDYMLKGEKPARWITEGLPAVRKGKDWGLEIVD